MTGANARGRPRSERARQAVLEAASEGVRTVGYERLTIEGIAERAGVGRQTIYRWWRSKAAILAEAALAGFVTLAAPPPPTDTPGGVAMWLRDMTRLLSDPENAALVRALTAAAASDAADSKALYEAFTRTAHSQLVGMLSDATAAGVVRDDVDLGTAADALIGALLYRVLTRQDVPADYAASLLTPFLAAS